MTLLSQRWFGRCEKKGLVAENLFPLLVRRWKIRQRIPHMVKIVRKEKTKDSENEIGVSWHEKLF